MSLYNELKRRNVFRVAVAYLALAWLATEVTGTLFPAFGVPEWVFRFVVITLAFGFLLALVISWAYEITPEGLKREKEVQREDSITHLTAKHLDVITIVLIAAAVLFVVADRFWLSPGQPGEPVIGTTAALERTRAVEAGTEPRGRSSNSIAVLPFLNMSDDAGNEYFSDGITEEILNLLAMVPELRVISRSSAFSYKDQYYRITDVAQALDVDHVLEGSVRKSGNRVRITAQLIHARSDRHMWSETYDRTLEDIFAIQDEIAEMVVSQLKVTLLGGVPTVKQTDPEAYTLYLQARYLGTRFTAEASAQSVAMYKQVLEIDPDYVSAWSGLAKNYLDQYLLGQLSRDESIQQARIAASHALVLDPDHAPAHAHLSRIELTYDRDLRVAAQHLEHALALEPTNPDILRRAVYLAYRLGRLDEAVALGKYVVERDPVNPESHYYFGVSLLWAGRLDEAIDSFRTTLKLSPDYIAARYRIGVALLLKGEPQAALVEIQQEQFEGKRLEGEAIAYYALSQQARSDAALMGLIEKYAQNSSYNIAYVLAFRNEPDRAFSWLEKAVKDKDSGLTQIANQPEFTNIHDDPRWLPFLESIGTSPEQLDAIEFNFTLPDQAS